MVDTLRRLSAILCADIAGYSRLVGANEENTIATIKATRIDLIDPNITAYHGRIVKTTGDGLLVEFPSVVDATRCAVTIQVQMAQLNKPLPADHRIDWRMGIHLGDIVVDDTDILGDAVNITSRIESITEPGGISLSQQAHDQVVDKLPLDFQALGSHILKNIAKPIEVFAVVLPGNAQGFEANGTIMESQQGPIRYCRAPDGVRLAYRTVGKGPLMVRAGAFLSHIQYDWKCFGHIYGGLAKTCTLLRYDVRGNGASDWDVPEISLEAWVRDLETVVDAAGANHFILLGLSQGCAVSIAYAARHAERVSHLILYGGYAVGEMKRAKTEEEREKVRSTVNLARLGWHDENSAYRQLFTSRMLADATKERVDAFNELLLKAASPECAARYHIARGDIDVRELLTRITAPTLVMHTRGDAMQSVSLGRDIARSISGARFVSLEGKNHVFGPTEPAAERFFEEINLFLGQ